MSLKINITGTILSNSGLTLLDNNFSFIEMCIKSVDFYGNDTLVYAYINEVGSDNCLVSKDKVGTLAGFNSGVGREINLSGFFYQSEYACESSICVNTEDFNLN